MKKTTLIVAIAVLLPVFAFAQKPNPPATFKATASVSVATISEDVEATVVTNQMMITFMQRMKTGNFAEAKTIALDMIRDNEKYVDAPEVEYRAFSTLMEKKYYDMANAREGRKAEVVWLSQPIADGFYFLAMVAFQENKPAEALEFLQKAITWNPVHSPFYAERGFMLLHQENRTELAMVLAAYLRALELADNYVDFAAALRGVGFIMVEKGDLEAGLACYLRSKLYDSSDKAADKEIHYIRSLAPGLGKELDGTKAVEILKKNRIPSGIDATHIQVLLSIADDLRKASKPKEEKAILKQAELLDPKNQDIKKRLSGLK